MDADLARRFDIEFAPRIAQTLAQIFEGKARAEVVPCGDAEHPTAIVLRSAPHEHIRGYQHPLNIRFTWDPDEIKTLVGPHGRARFAHYLEALPRKLSAWEAARDIDFASRSQAEPAILLGNLDFEG
ncbi:hypothetical protein B0G57_10336 [Trinickia symbiotica]|uniref:DUF5594 domain-containing protein n=1 Tax=Trinickia symbiotica TaxID=863227 RepID=A0A2N7X4B6_9BURK|nr:DUF5594 family protein [Trinickia symbiotica]PMS36596.1 hypothetical protein C0Z20_10795 [Trinickia symbiotica]PPK46012.1 hypothetical protein B0G57_10336 [Trinickia symbiotica]